MLLTNRVKIFSRYLQLSSFVEYTWQCMKLPSLDHLSEEGQLGESHILNQQLHEPTALLSPAMAAADSTTQGK